MAMLISPNTINQGRILYTNGDGSGATLLGTTPVVYKIATNGCNAAKLLIDVVSATGVAVTFVFVDGSAVTDAGLMTEGAQRFIAPLTFQALSGHPVRTSLWDEAAEAAMGHIELARWADRIVVAPGTADLLARLAQGHVSW